MYPPTMYAQGSFFLARKIYRPFLQKSPIVDMLDPVLTSSLPIEAELVGDPDIEPDLIEVVDGLPDEGSLPDEEALNLLVDFLL